MAVTFRSPYATLRDANDLMKDQMTLWTDRVDLKAELRQASETADGSTWHLERPEPVHHAVGVANAFAVGKVWNGQFQLQGNGSRRQ